MTEQGQNIGNVQIIDRIAKGLASDYRFSRRAGLKALLATAIGGGLGITGAPNAIDAGEFLGGSLLRFARSFDARPALAQVAFPSWALSVNGAPESAGGMVPFRLASVPGNTIEVIGGPMSYQDPSGEMFDFPGQENGEDRASVVIIDAGTPGIELVAWGGGNWYGITPNRNGEIRLSRESEAILVADAHKSLTDPSIGNGKGKDGVQGPIDYAKIYGPTGQLVKRGKIVGGKLELNLDIDHEQLATTQGTPQGQPSSDGEQSQPGFVDGQSSVVATQPVVGETTEPGFVGSQTEQTLSERSYNVQPGQIVLVPKGSIIRGEFMFKDQNGNWVVKYDSDSESGLVSIVDQDIEVMSNYAFGVVENPSGDINVRVQGFQTEQNSTGCDGNGCSHGTFIAHVPNGPFQKN